MWILCVTKIGVGGISTKGNPLMYAKLPGLHDRVGKTHDIEENVLEKVVQLEFQANRKIELCSVEMTGETFEKWKNLIVDDAFIRFYFGKVVKRAPLRDLSTNDPYIFTDFKLTISTNEPCQYFAESSMSYLLEKGQIMNVTLLFKSVVFDTIDSEFGYFNAFVCLFGVILMFGAGILGYCYKSKFPSVSVVWVASVWNRSRSFRATNVMALFGLQCLVSFLLLSFLQGFFELNLIVVLFVLMVSELVVGTVLQVTSSLFRFERAQVLPLLACASPVFWALFELQILWSEYVYDRFCGISFIRLVFLMLVFGGFSYIFLLLGLKLSPTLKNMAEKETQKKQNWPKLIWFTVIRCVFGILYVPVLEHACDVLLDDHNLDIGFVMSNIILHCGIACLMAIRNTAHELGMSSNSWQDCHSTAYSVSSAINALYVICDLLIGRGLAIPTETFRISCVFVILMSFVSSLMSHAVSYYTSVMFTYYLTKSFDEPAGIL